MMRPALPPITPPSNPPRLPGKADLPMGGPPAGCAPLLQHALLEEPSVMLRDGGVIATTTSPAFTDTSLLVNGSSVALPFMVVRLFLGSLVAEKPGTP